MPKACAFWESPSSRGQIKAWMWMAVWITIWNKSSDTSTLTIRPCAQQTFIELLLCSQNINTGAYGLGSSASVQWEWYVLILCSFLYLSRWSTSKETDLGIGVEKGSGDLPKPLGRACWAQQLGRDSVSECVFLFLHKGCCDVEIYGLKALGKIFPEIF